MRRFLQSHFCSPAVIVALVTALSVTVSFPGQHTSDSLSQLAQAMDGKYEDWHPPIMAVVWAGLVRLTGTHGSLLVLHQALFGLGFALFADALRRAGRHYQAWLIALATCFPFFLLANRFLVKDVGMASALIACTGLHFWFRMQNRRMPLWAILCALLCLSYGLLLRQNAIFAIGPLVLLWLPQLRNRAIATWVLASIVVSALALPLSDFINHRVLHATRTDVMQQLQIFDLMGIAARTGDVHVWRDYRVPIEDIRACYTPIGWDTFSSWGSCADLRRAIDHTDSFTPRNVIESRYSMWRGAILNHPLAYVEHRATHFNCSVYFLVPSFRTRYKYPNVPLGGEPDAASLERTIALDYVKRPFLVWPITWLLFGLSALAFMRSDPRTAAQSQFSKALLLSALLYSSSYFVIGIATSDRYHYWSIAAICVGVLTGLENLRKPLQERAVTRRLALLISICTVMAGYMARLADIDIL